MQLPSGPARILGALHHRNFAIYTLGNAVSLTGTWMQRVAIGWLTWELTHSGLWLGIISFADLFPSLIVGPIAGAAADRWDRLRVTRVSQALAMIHSVVLFALTAMGWITIELLLGLTLYLGVVIGFNQPARMALVPALVPREQVPTALATNSIIFNSARFVGPAAAGLAIVWGGVAVAFLVNSLTFVVFLVCLARLRLDPAALRPAARPRGFLHEMNAGIRYTARHEGIGTLILLLLTVCLFTRPFVELLPGFADAVFDAGAGGLALLTSTIGAGAMLGGLWLSGRPDQRDLTRIVLLASAAQCLTLLAFVATDSLWLALPALAVAGFAMVAGGVGSQTLVQHAVAEDMRGRVMSFYGLTFRCGPALGALVMGWASEFMGLRWPLAIGAALTLALCLRLWLRRDRIAQAAETAVQT
ncbi:MAG: MFS transporter [Rhodospirillaceae bacterium]|jgi:MFS family permease|nr:MFS transporter [Rhodospirillaceae bacterium]